MFMVIKTRDWLIIVFHPRCGIVTQRKNQMGVEKTLNLKLKTEQKDQLPHNIYVNYSKSDTDATSEVVKNVVEKVLDKENENNVFENNQPKFDKESSSSQPESDESFHDNYLGKSGNSSNDDPNILMYKMCGSDQLYSDSECEFDPSQKSF
ncbi:hypothetical protein Hanom_Chr05g00390621 [Helianthus anomalus]